MKAKANTTTEQSNEKSMEFGDPRMTEMVKQEKKTQEQKNCMKKLSQIRLNKLDYVVCINTITNHDIKGPSCVKTVNVLLSTPVFFIEP